MWTCPTCHRSFKNKDQYHSCALITTDAVFAKRPSELKKIYELLIKAVKKLGTYREETLKDAIYFKTKSTFLAIKVKKNCLHIEFFLDHLEDVPPVSKWLQTSKHRVVHLVQIDREKDITPQLLNWIKSSHRLIAKV